MSKYTTLIVGVVAGAALGAGTVESIRAQSSGPVYLVSEIDVSNPQAYASEYAPKVQASIAAHGGRIVALGGPQGGGAKSLKALEGDAPKRAAIQEWPSMKAINDWWNSADYKAARAVGDKYAKFRIYVVDGVDLSK